MEHKMLPQRLVRNAGVFYVCHRLSQMGCNATPTMSANGSRSHRNDSCAFRYRYDYFRRPKGSLGVCTSVS
jgi:hypothetical protein